MHLTSIVEGQLADDRDRLDALVSCFPGGHRVGRAEGARDADHPRARAVAARPLRRRGRLPRLRRQPRLLHRDPHGHHVEGGKAYVQAGAGIVTDSNPTAEYEETRDKARALMRALELAQAGLVARHGPRHRQLRFVHLQPRAVPGRARAPRSRCVRNDAVTVDEIARARARRASSSRPGPGRPEDAGITMDVIRAARADDADPRRVPRASGDRRACSAGRSCARRVPMHGKTSTIEHDGRGVFTGIAAPFVAVALSLAGRRRRRAAGRARGDGADAARTASIMGLRHRDVAGARRAVPSRVDPDRRRPSACCATSSKDGWTEPCFPH